MFRWIGRLAALAVALVLVAVLAGWLVLRASLPTIDGDLSVEGLATRATIARDADGIPTITAANRRDLAFATGFAHAQDRYFQMDLIRRRAAGELSAIIGAATLESDQRHRFHRFRSRAEAEIASLDATERDLLEAYAAGANAGLKSLGSKPFEYWLLGVEPEPWRAEDTVLVVYAMFMTLNDSRASRDVRRSYVRNVLSDAAYDWLYPDGTYWDAPIVGSPRPELPIPGPDALSLKDVTVLPGSESEVTEPPIPGSNNWVVSGALTGTGQALVANDMHLGISVPNIYYQARLVTNGSEPRDTMGVTLPGSPFVVAGSNEFVAWGYTNSYGDWSDAILLKPGATPGTYRTPEGDRPFDRHVELIDIKGQAPVEYEIRETIWGPVDEVDYPDGDIAISWIAHKPEGINIKLVDLEAATSVEEAVGIANTMGIPPQNFVTGDRDGNIAWTIAGSIPVKGDIDPLLPSDWSENHGWTGWLEPEEYPRIINPPSGRIWTANTRVVDGDYLRLIGDGGYDRGARGSQIRDQLLEGDGFEPEDMLAIQIDDRALFLARWQELVVELLSDAANTGGEAELEEFLAIVSNWVPRAAPESVGYRLVRGFRLEVQERTWSALMAPVREVYGDDVDLWRSPQFEAAMWQLVTEQPEHLLPQSYASWDAFLVDAVRGTIEYYDENYETPLGDRSWGELNTARIQHPLSLAVPQLAGWLDMPRDRLPGDADLPRAQGPGFGASERFAVSPGDRANGIMHMPVGQSGHPLSPYYARGHRDWVEGRASPFLPGSASHTLTLEPAP